jgi:large subunit GTPase 1
MAGGKRKTQQHGNSSLGKALIKKHAQKHLARKIEPGELHKHTVDIPSEKPRIMSIIDQNSLDEFVQLAQLSNKQFTAEKEGVVIVNRKEVLQGSTESATAQKELLSNFMITESAIKNPKYTLLKIPRRPKWTTEMSAQEIQTQENIAFLQWRRDIAMIEENNMTLAITPFEKNIEVWKQLWRVIERAHVLLQIVDARNPYFYYSSDLEKYIKEVDKGKGDKQFLLLVNKADYLTQELREHWSAYFKANNINHVFFSALIEQEKIDKNTDEEGEDSEDEAAGIKLVDKEKEKEQEMQEQREAFA